MEEVKNYSVTEDCLAYVEKQLHYASQAVHVGDKFEALRHIHLAAEELDRIEDGR